jgi:hypothetical protein
MSESANLKTQAAAGRVLDLLSRVFMEAGLGAESFVEEAERACVRAAHRKCVEDGIAKPRQPVVSQISAMTGMRAAKVALLLRRGKARPLVPESGQQPRTERVLNGWHQDPEFTDAAGDPAILPMRGKRGSFVALVKKYGGVRRAASILQQLENAKAARKTPDGVEALRRTAVTVNWTAEGITAFATQAVDYLQAQLRNLRSPGQAALLRYIVNTQIDPDELPVVLAQLQRQTDNFAATVEETVNHPKNTLPGSGVRIGIGMFPVLDPPVGNARRSPRTRHGKK